MVYFISYQFNAKKTINKTYKYTKIKPAVLP